MDVWVAGVLITVFVVLALAIRRQPDPLERALDDTTTFAGKSELTNNADRSRNLPPPN
jgi:hypothetical protein